MSGAAEHAPALRVTWLGHSTVVLDVRAADGRTTRLVTDPLLGRHAGLLRRRGERPDEEAWRHADAALVSHLHHDHAELRSLRLLGDVPVLAARANARWLRDKGLRGVGLDGAWHETAGHGTAGHGAGHGAGAGRWHEGDWYDVAGVQVRLTPAVHGHRPMPHRPNAAAGHVVRAAPGGSGGPGGGPTVWAVGDTERSTALSRVRDLAGGRVDVALVPVSGWGPRLSGGHLGPVQAAELCAEVGARVAIPVHWGTLHAPGGRHLPPGWMDHAGAAFAAALRRTAPEARAVVLRPGGTWDEEWSGERGGEGDGERGP
ncbi:MBL fold metallo-hydrolase [Isoptericola cucumis]|uniref:Metallo-beta-lactamase domain-containing protein n=2 Tax=Isoptericola cucumis TaxID=1776856 RepID=A0ABQ2B4K2_9MICO|nr:MBL fold metallo-hydrolase [Isoptericola cucumis]GGI07841.1 hypothetical protein GCM10007368_18180 [Isoptericola cucumis]